MEQESAKFGLHVSWMKTKIQNVAARPPARCITVNGHNVNVSEFTYLGHKIVSNNSMPDCLWRIALASRVMSDLADVWQQQNISLTNQDLALLSMCDISSVVWCWHLDINWARVAESSSLSHELSAPYSGCQVVWLCYQRVNMHNNRPSRHQGHCSAKKTGTFYARQRSYSAYMQWQFRPSVCPSVCLSVDGWISQKRLKLGSRNFHHTVAPSLQFFGGKFHPEILRGSPRAGASNKGGVGKISHFLPLSVNISKTVPDTTKVTIDH